MSSPKMTRMFGRWPDAAAGAAGRCCACAVVTAAAAVKADDAASAELATKMLRRLNVMSRAAEDVGGRRPVSLLMIRSALRAGRRPPESGCEPVLRRQCLAADGARILDLGPTGVFPGSGMSAGIISGCIGAGDTGTVAAAHRAVRRVVS